MNKPKAISLFCGAGGCSLGFKKAGFNILYAQDINETFAATYTANFSGTMCEVADISMFNFEKLMSSLRLKPYDLDILIGGPPCQGFSTAGARFWDDPRNKLLLNYVKALRVIKPKWFLMENVEGLLTSNKGQYLFEAVKSFLDMGYNVRIDKIYSQEYGIPQRRKRVFIIGSLDQEFFILPRETHIASGSIYRNGGVNIMDVIEGLPSPANNDVMSLPYNKPSQNEIEELLRNKEGFVTDHYISKINEADLKRIQLLKPGQTMKDLPEELQHESFKRRAYRRVKDGTPSEKRGGAPSGMKRLFPNEPSLTITSASIREFIHPFENRPLTIRECARIQTFPDSFIFTGTASQKIQQIANAIPPLLAEIFAVHIKKMLCESNILHKGRGKLISYSLTKASAKSPALNRTEKLLKSIENSPVRQLTLVGEC